MAQLESVMDKPGDCSSQLQSILQSLIEIYQSMNRSTVNVNDSHNAQECSWTKGSAFFVLNLSFSVVILLYFVLFNATSIGQLLRIRLRPLVPMDFIGIRKSRTSNEIAFYISASYIMEFIYSESLERTCSDIPPILKIILTGCLCYPFFAVGSSESIIGYIIGILYATTIFSCGIYFEWIHSPVHRNLALFFDMSSFPHPVYFKYFFLIVFIIYSLFCVIRLHWKGIKPSDATTIREKAIARAYVKRTLHRPSSNGNTRTEAQLMPTSRFTSSLKVAVCLLLWMLIILICLTIGARQTLNKMLPIKQLQTSLTFANLTNSPDFNSCLTKYNAESQACAMVNCMYNAMRQMIVMVLVIVFVFVLKVIEHLINSLTTYLIVAVCLAFITSMSHFPFIKRNFVRNLRLAYKGQYPPMHNPSTRNSARALGNFACFTGYNVSYLLMGYIVFCGFFFALVCILGLFGALIYHGYGSVLFKKIIWSDVCLWSTLFFILILTRYLLTRFVFVHNSQYISVDNRKAFLFWSYFTYFTDIPLGCLSFTVRTVINFLLNVYFFGRIDVAILPGSFETYDNGYNVYSGFVLTEAALNHPILRAFVDLFLEVQTCWRTKLLNVGDRESLQVLTSSSDTDLSTNRKPKMSRELRIRKWQLLYTLVRNPSLVKDRKHNVRSQRLNRVV